jgi:hypothetical protein
MNKFEDRYAVSIDSSDNENYGIIGRFDTKRDAMKEASYIRRHGHSTVQTETAQKVSWYMVTIYDTYRNDTVYCKPFTDKYLNTLKP